ncbi:MAG: type I-E CRISPR-associated protein Cas5/CasD [Symbiobacteriia bacterium]
MGKPLLLLRLEGPLQAWGLRARWDVRDTGDEPSKSGIMGLLGCALGYPHYDPRLEELDQELTMGVRVERPGTRLTDFQTASGSFLTAAGGVRGSADDPATIISPRAYLQDAAFLVVLGGRPDVLERCRAALARPQWPIYLGRKACPPTRPVLVGITDVYDSIEDAMQQHPWTWEGRRTLRELPPKKLRCTVETEGGQYLRPDRIRTNPARMYESRAVEAHWVDFPGAADEPEGEAV